MRFFADGPNIPDELLEQRDQGNVVFLCGAGISAPAGLPGFMELARQVMEELGTSEQAYSHVLLRQADAAERAGAAYGPPLDQVFHALREEYGARTIDEIVSQKLKTPRGAATGAHEIVLRLSRNAAGAPQVITTNFDLLFERAAGRPRIRCHVPPALPAIASGQAWSGIVYLHGRLSPKPRSGSTEPGLIISSADFGRAYLAEAWATRFVRDLLKHHVIVLLGYSAADPPVRYLLEGLHSRHGGAQPSAIFAFDKGPEALVHERWRDRGVHAIAYPESDAAHSALWDTLEAWAARADDPEAWRRTVVGLARQGPRNLAPHERGQVASLVRSAAGAKLFADADPPPPAEWVCVFDRYVRFAAASTDPFRDGERFDPLETYGLDDDPPRPPKSGPLAEPVGDDLFLLRATDGQVDNGPRLAGAGPEMMASLSPRLFHLARWLRCVMEEPVALWWAAGYRALHPELLRLIEPSGGWSDQAEQHAYEMWSLLLEAMRHAPTDDHDGEWYDWLARLKRERWTGGSLREFERVAQPYLRPKRPWLRRRPPVGDWGGLSRREVVEFEVVYPGSHAPNQLPVPSEQLYAVFRVLRRGLERAAQLLAEIDQPFWRSATLFPEEGPGERALADADRYLDRVVRLFDRLTREHPAIARDEVGRWPPDDPYFFDKLKLYAWIKPELFTGTEAADGMLSLTDEGFWDHNHRRELLHALRARWSDFTPADRRRIETRIIPGCPRLAHEDDDAFQRRRASTSATVLGWLERNGCTLSDEAHESMVRLRTVDSRWRASWDRFADASLEGRSGWVKTNSDPSALMDAPLSEVITRAQEHTAQRLSELTEYKPFQGLVQQRPVRAVAALTYASRQGWYPTELWCTAMSSWPEGASERLRWLFARRVSRLPSEVILELRFEVPEWLKAHLPALAASEIDEAVTIWDAIAGHFANADGDATKSGIGEVSVAGEPLKRSRRTYMHALNSPVGKLTDALLIMLDQLQLGHGAGLPTEFRSRLEWLFGFSGEGPDHAVGIVAHHLHWLHQLDPDWVYRGLLPRFQPQHACAEPAWSGLAYCGRLPAPELFERLKPHFLEVLAEVGTWGWEQEPKRSLHWMLVGACYRYRKDERYVGYAEARDALQNTDDEGRAHALWFLARLVREQRAWRSFGKPFLAHAWPREARCRTERTSRHLAQLAAEAGEHFPEVVKAILPLLTPVNHLDALHRPLKDSLDDQHSAPPTRYPEATLALLDRLIRDDAPRAPYGLSAAIDTIAEAEPALRQDRRWRRLNDIRHRL